MNFTESIKTCFQKYFDFSGRAMRSEYWWFYLFTVVGGIGCDAIDIGIFAATGSNEIGILGLIFTFGTIVPTVSAAARRLHDTNRSGWWQLLPLAGIIPFGMALGAFYFGTGLDAEPNRFGIIFMIFCGLILAGLIILLIVWFATDSDREANRFGPSPKYESAADTFS